MEKELLEMEKYAEEYNVPILEKASVEFIKKYIKLNHPKKILEIGSAIGYSAICMASVDDDIEVTTIERDEKRYMEAIKNIKKCGLEHRIEVVFQDALDVNLVGRNYDMIFIDAAKGQYIKFFEKFSHYLNPNGVIITDNINFHGLVNHKKDDMSKNLTGLVTKIEEYIEFLKTHPEFTTVIRDVGDGLSFSYRKNGN